MGFRVTKPFILPGDLSPANVKKRCFRTSGHLRSKGLASKVVIFRYAAGAIVQYLKDTQPDSLRLLTGLRSYSINEFMTFDAATRRNLELDQTLRGEHKGSLLGTLDQTVTPMGKRMIHQWVSQPLLNVERIKRRQNGVQYFFDDGMKRAELRGAQTAGRSRTVGQSSFGWLCPTARPGRHARYTFTTFQYSEYYRSG